jgi:pimeloyl-ACP methyl ester carboxylesterase
MQTHIPFLLAALLVHAPALAGNSISDATTRGEDIEFESHGARLAGSVVLPQGIRIHAAVVFVHGSGKQTRNIQLAEQFARAGIAALVYDKRGVGMSGGEYEGNRNVSEQNLELLADDAAAALKALASHPALKDVPLGITGISQAGWIAPLAAERSRHADFLVLWSGPVCKVSEEDIYSKFTADSDGKVVPTYQEALSSRTQEYIWPEFMGKDTDPVDSLRKLSIPGLWIFSDNDGSIPVDVSLANLKGLQRTGHRYEYVMFAGLGHNNMDGTFAAATDWIRELPGRTN